MYNIVHVFNLFDYIFYSIVILYRKYESVAQAFLFISCTGFLYRIAAANPAVCLRDK